MSNTNYSLLRQKYEESYLQNYKQLNPAQKKAVDIIDGPVMVIAGPGTGKTQILATRIGNILRQGDTQAHNILCLTFTDAATIAMRNRLVQIIGPEAHNIHIYTFHGFCNQVIQENLDIFGNYRQLEPLTELEKVDVFAEIVDGLPKEHRLKRLKGDYNFEATRLANLFDLMKKENLNTKDVHKNIDMYLDKVKNADSGTDLYKSFYYQRKSGENKPGDLKIKEWKKLTDKMEDLREASNLFDLYNSIMDRIGRYDYNDMIDWVLKRFQTDEALLSNYQERYQFVLVDEYQDTNGAQRQIFELLISYWEDKPNAFIVGDDDQAIYKFQGANLKNLKEFLSKYKPELVVLENNYRSTQPILDLSKYLIELNQERIINEPDISVDKDLIASNKDRNNIKAKPIVRNFTNVVHEQAWIAAQLVAKMEAGERLEDIAIIYRTHRQVEKLVNALEKVGVPLNVKRRVNILYHPLIDNLLNLLTYIQGEYDKPNSTENYLFEILHYDFFNINSTDIAKIALHCRSAYKDSNDATNKLLPRIKWLDVIKDESVLNNIGCETTKEILSAAERLQKWVSDIANTTIQQLFENILNEGRVLQSIIKDADKTWLLQVVSTIFDLIKDESTKRPELSLKEFLEIIEKMKSHDIPLQINKVVSSQDGVNFITAHSAKGLEFDEVYMIGCTKDKWDSKRGGNQRYSFPDNMNEDADTNDQDERRLFYVAMTRAQTKLNISYAVKKEDGKELGKSKHVDELSHLHYDIIEQKVDQESLDHFQYLTLLKQEKKIQLIEKDLIDRILEKYVLSVTGLNKYLKCPMTFYFETILKVPTARNKYMGFGRAIHYALEMYFDAKNKNEKADEEELVNFFHSGMRSHKSHFTDKEYQNMTDYGDKILPQYLEHQLSQLQESERYELEIKIKEAHYKHVPIKGVLDRVDVKSGGEIIVTDYKTGKFDKPKTRGNLKSPDDKNPLGGDYWRQIVFYKLLVDSDKKHNWNMTTGFVDFVEPKQKTTEFKSAKFVISPQHIETVGEQIEESWQKIQDHDFNRLCDNEDCYWCDFVRNDYVFTQEKERDVEDDLQLS